MNPPFIIFALPRSRTAWLSQFLSYRDWICGHDQLRYMRSLDDVKAWLSLEQTGTCETGAAPFWRLLIKYRPDVRVITIRRPVEEVVESLSKVGVQQDLEAMRKVLIGLDHKLDQIEGRIPNVKSVKYNDLKDEIACAELFEFCLPYGHDREWWKAADARNVQINFPALVRYVSVHLAAINRLKAQAQLMMFKDLATKPVAMTGVTLKEVSFEDWVRDCGHLFREHQAIVGEHPDNWLMTNIPLMSEMYDVGQLQLMVGYSNGRPFGYLMSVIYPSLEGVSVKSSQNLAFFASDAMPGLGLKLQRAALAALKKKGVRETFMRAGIRGDGPRIDALYRRIGAQDYGNIYRVGLEN